MSNSHPAKPSLCYPQVMVAGLSALVLTVGIGRFAYTPLLPLMHDEAGLSLQAGGWLASSNYAGYLLGIVIAASLSQLQQKYRLYQLSIILSMVSTAGMGLSQQLGWWLLWRLVSGMCSVGGLLLASGLILNWLISQGRRAELGLHFAGLGLGIVVVGVATAAMSRHLDWQQQWLALALMSLLFALPAWRWMPAPTSSSTTPASKVSFLKDRFMLYLSFAYFCGGFAYAIGATFIVQILQKIPLLAAYGGLVWALVGLAALPASLLWDRLALATSTPAMLKLAFVIQLLSLLLPLESRNLWLNLLSALLFGNSFVAIVSLTLTMIGRRCPQNPAKAMAKLTLSYGVAQIVAPALAGILASHSGNYHQALALSVLLLLLGWFGLKLSPAGQVSA